jgi:phosphatidylserine/phosphatidylglycerophosphate/cardiolipin synthase-like enzyme
MLIEEIYELLGGDDNPDCGITYGLSSGNCWEGLFATPEPAVGHGLPAAGNLIRAIGNLIASARHTVDIATQAPLPDGAFLKAIGEGIRVATAAGYKLVVRILQGIHDPVSVAAVDPMPGMLAFLRELDLPAGVPVYVGAMQSGRTSWNHAKLIVVDGARAITGGHNMWTDTYHGNAPVHDVSIGLSGPAVAVAQNFLDKQWTVLADRSRMPGKTSSHWSRLQLDGMLYDNALPSIRSAMPQATGNTRVLALARMDANMLPSSSTTNASRTARIAAVKRARSHIRLSQQMLGGPPMAQIDEAFFRALCEHVAAGKQLSIVVSDTGAASAAGVPYCGYGVAKTAEHIAAEVGLITGKTGVELAQLLCAHVQVGPVRFADGQPDDPATQSWKWRHGATRIEPANHAKVFIIDEDAFYVGSDNAYAFPRRAEGLQEFGFLV